MVEIQGGNINRDQKSKGTIAVVASDLRSLVRSRLDLLLLFQKQGIKIKIFAPYVSYKDASYQKILRKYKIDLIKLSPFSKKRVFGKYFTVFRSFFRLIRLFKKNKITDVITVHGALSHFGILAAAWAGIEKRFSILGSAGLVVPPDTTLGKTKSWFHKKMLKRMGHLSTKILVQNQKDAKLLVKGNLVPQEKIVVVKGAGINLKNFKQEPLNQITPLTFLYVGRLNREKGFVEFCEAVQLVRKKYPGMIFNAIGGLARVPGKKKDYYQELALDSGVNYVGDVDDVLPYFKASHVVVLPSYGEATPKALSEALAIGRPIITTNVSGCEETVTPEKNGLLVHTHDPWAISQAMVYFIETPEKLQEMAMASRQLAEEEFDVKGVNTLITDTVFTYS